MTSQQIHDANFRIDQKLTDAVRRILGTECVSLAYHKPTGRGTQTVPVFRVPLELAFNAKALGLTIVERRTA